MGAGEKPALSGSRTSDPYLRANPSAIWLRHEFPMQRNRTRFTALSLADRIILFFGRDFVNKVLVNLIIGAQFRMKCGHHVPALF